MEVSSSAKAIIRQAIFIASCAVLAIVGLGLTGWVVWHLLSPIGSLAMYEQARESIRVDHQAGEHERVIVRFVTPVDVRLFEDFSLEWSNDNSAELLFMVGESYRLTGDKDAAERLFLRVIGWSKVEYEAYCRLEFTDCSDSSNLRDMAQAHQSVEAK